MGPTQAKEKIEKAGFKATEGSQVPSNAQAGAVAYTEPSGQALKGSRVTMYVSSGVPPYTPPPYTPPPYTPPPAPTTTQAPVPQPSTTSAPKTTSKTSSRTTSPKPTSKTSSPKATRKTADPPKPKKTDTKN